MMTTVTVLLAACTICVAAETNLPPDILAGSPTFAPTNSPVTVVTTNSDATVVMKVTPRVYLSELGCTMLVGPDGMTMSEMYDVLRFQLGTNSHVVIWGAHHTGPAPFALDPKKEYRFLVKPHTSGFAQVLKVWLDDKVLLDRTKKKEKPQPSTEGDGLRPAP